MPITEKSSPEWRQHEIKRGISLRLLELAEQRFGVPKDVFRTDESGDGALHAEDRGLGADGGGAPLESLSCLPARIARQGM